MVAIQAQKLIRWKVIKTEIDNQWLLMATDQARKLIRWKVFNIQWKLTGSWWPQSRLGSWYAEKYWNSFGKSIVLGSRSPGSGIDTLISGIAKEIMHVNWHCMDTIQNNQTIQGFTNDRMLDSKDAKLMLIIHRHNSNGSLCRSIEILIFIQGNVKVWAI